MGRPAEQALDKEEQCSKHGCTDDHAEKRQADGLEDREDRLHSLVWMRWSCGQPPEREEYCANANGQKHGRNARLNGRVKVQPEERPADQHEQNSDNEDCGSHADT